MKTLSVEDIKARTQGVVELKEDRVNVLDAEKVRGELIDDLIYTAVFGDEKAKELARWLIRAIALELNIVPASIHDLYTKGMANEEIDKWFTVPAMNIRGMTYDVMRQIFKVAVDKNVRAFILEIAKSEIGYTDQRPAEYTACALAAAIKEGFEGPVFIQGDHFQFNAKRYFENPEKELESIKALTKEAIEADFFNIDIDPSTLVDYSKPTLKEQQLHNYLNTAKMTAYIREIEPEGVTVSVGGEIGHIGGKNSTPEEFEAFMEGYLEELRKYGENLPHISKISVQTGTEHGGIPLPDGRVAEVKLDFSVLESIGEIARKKYQMAGAVQHGASTLPDELFHKFPEVKTAEIHLATGFQNIIYEYLPEDFKQEIYNWLKTELKNEWKEGWTEQQFIYKTRKKAFGKFKKAFWDLPHDVKRPMLDALLEKFHFLFDQLGVFDTKEVVNRYVKPVKIYKKQPE
ncbi:ketose-bisphosphate aldolase class-II [Thermovibrio ammonificans HB-1]|uniref:Ketose-bisphosphate aldolase class-II n=1 Tax=Thermovibrio ammonificans (strain DSM 15698 / JCM 12110 / HB-1) TaxID=648996 RepID=E8T695_THEA1|nr:class II fructose-bisphosphate aldolase [Thermovibrio ammonificans]ADU96679.1 ketose-bisphosphate aldolase class-II [Thermovibrio ammonificans HB-1]